MRKLSRVQMQNMIKARCYRFHSFSLPFISFLRVFYMGQNYHNMALPTTLQLQTPYPSTPSCYPSPRTIIPETLREREREREREERRENNRGREKEKGSSNSLTAVFPLTCTGSQEVHSPREGKLADIKLMGMQMVPSTTTSC